MDRTSDSDPLEFTKTRPETSEPRVLVPKSRTGAVDVQLRIAELERSGEIDKAKTLRSWAALYLHPYERCS